MSDDAQDATTEAAEAPEAAADDTAAAEAAKAAMDEIAEGSPVAETPAEHVTAEAPADEPVAEASIEAEPAAAEPASGETLEAVDAEPAVDEAPATASDTFGPVRVARVYVCERGHRTTTLWGQPDTCQAQPLRHGPTCGLTLYHITELPEQVQKALNPLKASKKASKKK